MHQSTPLPWLPRDVQEQLRRQRVKVEVGGATGPVLSCLLVFSCVAWHTSQRSPAIDVVVDVLDTSSLTLKATQKQARFRLRGSLLFDLVFQSVFQ